MLDIEVAYYIVFPSLFPFFSNLSLGAEKFHMPLSVPLPLPFLSLENEKGNTYLIHRKVWIFPSVGIIMMGKKKGGR